MPRNDDALLKLQARRSGFDPGQASVWRWWTSLPPEARVQLIHLCDLRWVRYLWQADETDEEGNWQKMPFVRGEKLLREYQRMEHDAMPEMLDLEEIVDWACNLEEWYVARYGTPPERISD